MSKEYKHGLLVRKKSEPRFLSKKNTKYSKRKMSIVIPRIGSTYLKLS